MELPIHRDITAYYEPLRRIIADWEIDPLFVTVIGVDVYGFPSSDSDFDLRGAFVQPSIEAAGPESPSDTLTRLCLVDGLDMDLVLHEIDKYVGMLAQGNGSILEEILSPLVLMGEETLAPLRELARGCITRRLYHHYNGFSRAQIAKLRDKDPKHIKTLLYIYRVLMTGIHVLETGELECNIRTLAERFPVEPLPDLISAKTEERSLLEAWDWPWHQRAIKGLQSRLSRAYKYSPLPNRPTVLGELSEYLARVRLAR